MAILNREIEFLGTSGTQTPEQGTTSIRVSKHCVIDAGNLIRRMGRDIYDVEHIFLTHSHLDHIVDIPFITELFVTNKKTTLKIYGLPETLRDLKDFIFNFRIWPNFEEIDLLQQTKKTLEFIELSLETTYSVDDIELMPFKTNHTEGSCGYIITHANNAVMFTSDTYRCDRIWELIDQNPQVHSLVIDVSFPSSYAQLASDSKHLTPALLFEERLKSKRNDFSIYPVHLKSQFEATIRHELKEQKIEGLVLKVVDDYTVLPYDRTLQVYKRDHHHSSLSQILMIGAALSSEKNIDSLLELIIKQSKLLTNADAGILYLYNERTRQLEFKVIQNDTLGISMGGRSDPIEWTPLEMYDSQGGQNRHMVATVCALDGYIINIPDVYMCKEYDFDGTKAFDETTGYHSQSMLVVPLKGHEENLIGVLQLINKKNHFADVVEFEFDDEELALSIGSQAAVALTKQKQINDLEVLLESFLHTINMAIEEKSPYTAGHIDRMMDLSLLLAHAINSDQSTFKDHFYTDEQIKELKLKYEILKRDAQIAYFNSSQSDEEKGLLESTLAQLDEEINFLVVAYEGSEYFSDENIERVKSIAARQIALHGTYEPILSVDEVANLTVQKGTLTAEQRESIVNHTDIFEALSASDRPYKKAKKLSEIMKILLLMAKDGYIDKDILSLLYTSGVCMTFAQKYLKPENIDEVKFEGV